MGTSGGAPNQWGQQGQGGMPGQASNQQQQGPMGQRTMQLQKSPVIEGRPDPQMGQQQPNQQQQQQQQQQLQQQQPPAQPAQEAPRPPDKSIPTVMMLQPKQNRVITMGKPQGLDPTAILQERENRLVPFILFDVF